MNIKKGAVIVETRVIPNLFEIIQDGHMKFVPLEWGLTMFLSEQNKHLIKREMFDGRNVEIIILPFDNFSVNDYNNLLTSQSFYECLDYDIFLVFQTDSRLLKNGIENYLAYDFIGAPIYHIPFPAMNGGLSIRNKKAMLNVIEKFPYKGVSIDGNEDTFICKRLNMINSILPTKEVAQTFSVETIFNLNSIGTHAIEKWLTPSQCNEIKNQYV